MKNILLVLLALGLLGMSWVAWRNSVPTCDYLEVREELGQRDLVCVYSFGDAQEDSVDFRLTDR